MLLLLYSLHAASTGCSVLSYTPCSYRDWPHHLSVHSVDLPTRKYAASHMQFLNTLAPKSVKHKITNDFFFILQDREREEENNNFPYKIPVSKT